MNDMNMCESPGTGVRRKPSIGPARRRELLALANDLATRIEANTQPHERRLLQYMVSTILDE